MATVTTGSTPTAEDRRRQVVVTVAEVFCVVGTLVGLGVLGTQVEDSAGGALAADATLLAPAGPAFSIWTPIYLGLLGYTVWQWLPEHATDRRHRATGWLAAASMVLNASWLLVTQQGWVWVSVVVILALAATLFALVDRLQRTPSYGVGESVLVDGTFGLYLGWVVVASAANVFAALSSSGVRLDGGALATVLALVGVGLVAAVGVGLARRFGGRWSVAVALAWGLAWAGWGRLADEPASVPVGLAALVAAVVVVAAATQEHARLTV
ncbi:tryptophan-rich sensory protein [Phycicoccus sp. BSK3Z-2]|uniref:Tryptophan-rich sensory protein n=1 Tax=Phycicoccus avicenniae TaxID=2828860 RepID=A0A941D9K5_9MICO|nr:tryptophan-rich sensory protein [Phycicoccus avicenniae]MBR7744629.1 tryptophan-rich sensory protein [Phycicoccus avicenniae]